MHDEPLTLREVAEQVNRLMQTQDPETRTNLVSVRYHNSCDRLIRFAPVHEADHETARTVPWR